MLSTPEPQHIQYIQFLLIWFVLFGAKDFLVIKLWLSNHEE